MSLILPPVAPTQYTTVDMDVQALVEEVWAKGFDCTWEVMAVCPCSRKVADPEADFAASLTYTQQGTCLACQGRGRIYHSSQTIPCVFLGSTGNLALDRIFGLGQPGVVKVTGVPESPLGEGDRLTINEPVIARRYTQTLVRGTGASDRLRFPVWPQTYTISNGAGGTTTSTKSAFYVVAADANGTIIGGATPTEYVAGVNFTVASGSELITWISGGPAAGSHYSVSYFCKPSYIVTAQPFIHRGAGAVESGTKVVQRLLSSASAALEDATPTGASKP